MDQDVYINAKNLMQKGSSTAGIPFKSVRPVTVVLLCTSGNLSVSENEAAAERLRDDE